MDDTWWRAGLRVGSVGFSLEDFGSAFSDSDAWSELSRAISTFCHKSCDLARFPRVSRAVQSAEDLDTSSSPHVR